MDSQTTRKLVTGSIAAIAVVGVGAAAGAAVGAGPFGSSGTRSDAAETSDDTTGVTTPDSLPDTSGPPAGQTRVDDDRVETRQLVSIPDGTTQTFAAGPAGFVTVARTGGTVSVVAVSPGTGWTFEIEPGDEPGEAEVDFRSGDARVQFNAELEDGAVRIRVRTRGVATAPDPTVGTLPSDNSGPGNAGDDDLDDIDDHSNSGPGSGDDTDDTEDVDDHSGPSVDDDSGSGGSGSDDSGSDDSDDSGSDDSDDSGSDDSGSGNGGPGGGHD
jgi:hypothetical protein